GGVRRRHIQPLGQRTAVVVQPALFQHRAAAEAERRGTGRGHHDQDPRRCARAGARGAGGGAVTGAEVPLESWLRQILRCPVTGTTPVDGTGPDGSPELVSTGSEPVLAYPVRDGVPVLAAHDARTVRS